VPLALGSDTNGSIRVPSSFCGIFGLKPTYGRLSRARSYPFVSSLDHLGPFARNVADLALAYDAMQGGDTDDVACTTRRSSRSRRCCRKASVICASRSPADIFKERVSGSAGGRRARRQGARRDQYCRAARGRARPCRRLHHHRHRGASLHLDRLRKRPNDFDPAVRDRLIAGAMIPAPYVDKAQKFRRWYRAKVLEIFGSVDVILAPATPCVAPKLGQVTFNLDGVELPVRAKSAFIPSRFPLSACRWSRPPCRWSRCRSACRSSPRPGARTSHFVLRTRWKRWVSSLRPRQEEFEMEFEMEIDSPEVLTEVTAQYARYEAALVTNDVAVLDELFRNDGRTLRYGVGEILYGFDASNRFAPRDRRSALAYHGQDRHHHLRPRHRVASTLFYRDAWAGGKVGRQMQTWIRFPEGWRIVAAHVSIIDEPRDAGPKT